MGVNTLNQSVNTGETVIDIIHYVIITKKVGKMFKHKSKTIIILSLLLLSFVVIANSQSQVFMTYHPKEYNEPMTEGLNWMISEVNWQYYSYGFMLHDVEVKIYTEALENEIAKEREDPYYLENPTQWYHFEVIGKFKIMITYNGTNLETRNITLKFIEEIDFDSAEYLYFIATERWEFFMPPDVEINRVLIMFNINATLTTSSGRYEGFSTAGFEHNLCITHIPEANIIPTTVSEFGLFGRKKC